MEFSMKLKETHIKYFKLKLSNILKH